MKVVVLRSNYSNVVIDNKVYRETDKGLVVLVCFTEGDTLDDINYIVKKIVNLRIFDDENGVMNKSILDVGGSILSISQFTLYAVTSKGNRPSYNLAMNGSEATKLYDLFNNKLNEQVKTYPGIFGADMTLHIENAGPITIIIDSKER